MANRESFVPTGTEWMESDFEMSPAIRVGDQVWLSGVTVAPQQDESLDDAFERTFSTIQRILGEAGLDWNDVVDVSSFHVDLQPHKEAILAVKRRYITEKPYPAWTAIEVKGLWGDTLVAEIKVVACAR